MHVVKVLEPTKKDTKAEAKKEEKQVRCGPAYHTLTLCLVKYMVLNFGNVQVAQDHGQDSEECHEDQPSFQEFLHWLAAIGSRGLDREPNGQKCVYL